MSNERKVVVEGKELKIEGYMPPAALLNLQNEDLASPTTRYEERKLVFDRQAIKNIIGNKR